MKEGEETHTHIISHAHTHSTHKHTLTHTHTRAKANRYTSTLVKTVSNHMTNMTTTKTFTLLFNEPLKGIPKQTS